MKNLIIASTSTLHGGDYLDYLLPTLENHFSNCESILFIPYARPGGISHDIYTEKVAEAFSKINKKITGIHKFENPIQAIQDAKGIFIGGGNDSSSLGNVSIGTGSMIKNTTGKFNTALGFSVLENNFMKMCQIFS